MKLRCIHLLIYRLIFHNRIKMSTKLQKRSIKLVVVTLVDPPKCEDMQSMVAFEAAFGSDPVFKGMGKTETAQLVKDRFDVMGTLLSRNNSEC